MKHPDFAYYIIAVTMACIVFAIIIGVMVVYL